MVKNKKFLASYWCVLIIELTNLYAQSGSVASGGDASGPGGKQNYSVGQVAYTSAVGSGGNINQGIQQPYVVIITSGEEVNNIQLIASVHPNPTVNMVTLSVNSDDTRNFSYALYDAVGKLIDNREVNSKQTNIPMEGLASGAYFIKVLNNKKEIKTFKIIKNS